MLIACLGWSRTQKETFVFDRLWYYQFIFIENAWIFLGDLISDALSKALQFIHNSF